MILGYLLRDYLNANVKVPVSVKLAKETSSILVTGKSGSGKSLSTEFYIYNMLKNGESAVYISDYKSAEEYEPLINCPSYKSSEEAIEMVENFYEFFSVIRKNKVRLDKHYTLVIEEWAGLINYTETISKKLCSELQRKLAEMLMVSRGLNIGVILCVQQASASVFSSSATREQFQAILSFGRCSTEQFKMLGLSNDDLNATITKDYKPGHALLLVDGQDSVKEIIVPFISNPKTMLKGIRHYLDLQSDLETLIHSPDLWK